MNNMKLGTFFMNFMGWYIIGMGLLMIFVTEIMFISDFFEYTGLTYQQYFEIDQAFAEIFILQKKVMGFMVCGIGILVLFIVQKGFQKREKWAWYALLIVGSLVWVTFIGYKIVIQYYGGSMITFVVGDILLDLGLLFSAKEILKK
ncbi:MAG: hypothetical protein EAX89_10525 [Candidatus Lokiarchaeota archaeon]|nr:hypothetical protein [Candidatus Lokiarchaeota archaeon]